MEAKKIIFKKEIVMNLDPVEMNAVKGGFDLEDYAGTYHDTNSGC